MEVAWFEDWVEDGVPREGREVFSTECRLSDFANTVRTALDHMLEKYGAEGYEQTWIEHGFPTAKYARLIEELARGPFTGGEGNERNAAEPT